MWMNFAAFVPLSLLLCGAPQFDKDWGFHAHRQINQLAIFTLPPEMLGFYKTNLDFITEKAVNPDQRRYVDPDEAVRHYIDLDAYGDSALYKMPRYWSQAAEMYGEDSLMQLGIVPWHIYTMKNFLTRAFMEKDADRILRLSADLGHYIADAHVPLHTTENYNGQLTGQEGIHGFWESRLPELFSSKYDFLVGKADYIDRPQLRAWEAVTSAHLALDSVLLFEADLSRRFSESKKFSFEQRGKSTVKVYSYEFSLAFERKLNGMVERQMRSALKMIGDFWYTSWVDGGQPDLGGLVLQGADTVRLELPKLNIKFRNHESGETQNE